MMVRKGKKVSPPHDSTRQPSRSSVQRDRYQSDNNWRCCWWPFFFVAVGLACLAALLAALAGEQRERLLGLFSHLPWARTSGWWTEDTHSSSNTGVPFVYTLVPRQPLGTRTYREIAELRSPLILSGTVADHWQAKTIFTPQFLSRNLPHVMAYSQEKERSFMTFHDHKPLEPLVREKWGDFNIKVNTTIPELLVWSPGEQSSLPPSPSPEGGDVSPQGPYLYFSQDVAQLRHDFPAILSYLQPLDPLILSNENVQVNLWIGRKGIITHTHYDATYNFFVQLFGRKRFTLFPPDQKMYLYPCLHPHYGHSQVDVRNPNYTLFPDFKDAEGLVAEVGPGDVLVVPPFWFHHVETLQESVSVNVWSDAPEYALLNKIYSKPVPFEEEWGTQELIRATVVYIAMILESLSGSVEGRAYIVPVEHVYQQRYTPVVESGNLLVNPSITDQMSNLCHTNGSEWEDAVSRYQPILRRGVSSLHSLFMQIPGIDTRLICLGNYIEHLIHTTAGAVAISPFLKHCLEPLGMCLQFIKI